MKTLTHTKKKAAAQLATNYFESGTYFPFVQKALEFVEKWSKKYETRDKFRNCVLRSSTELRRRSNEQEQGILP